MPAQLDYGYSIPKGVPGGKADLNRFEMVNTRSNEEPDGSLKFGMAVFTGKEKGYSVRKPVSGDDKSKFEGVVIAHANTEHDLDGIVNVREGKILSVMRRGRIWARISPECVPEYDKTAYVVADGDYAGCFTEQSAAYTAYLPCSADDEGAKEVIADTGSVSGEQIKVSEVKPVLPGYTPAVGDYVVSKQIHGATVDVGVKFGKYSDTANGIAIIEG